MLNVELNEVNGIATLTPDGALSEKDFESASTVIDPYIEKYGNLKGLIIYTKTFPGWDSFSSLIKHFKFVKEHHKKVSHVALVASFISRFTLFAIKSSIKQKKDTFPCINES